MSEQKQTDVVLAETTSDQMLLTAGGVIEWNRPSVVRRTHMLNEAVSLGKARTLATNLPEEAKDTEFAKFYLDHDKDWEAALENYLMSLNGTDSAQAEAEAKAEAEAQAQADAQAVPDSEPQAEQKLATKPAAKSAAKK